MRTTWRTPFTIGSVVVALAAAGSVLVLPAAVAAGETCYGQAATIVGAGAIEGTSGNDVIVGSPGADQIAGGEGNDVVCAAGGNDQVLTGGGDDTVLDGTGADTVDLGYGFDYLVASEVKDARDVVDGGDGVDAVDYGARTRPLKINLGTGTADDGEIGEADKLLGIENVGGGAGNDVISGSPEDNTIYGGPGVDEISYATRTENLDIILLSASTSGAPGEYDNIYEFENARGGKGHDEIRGNDGVNALYGGDGADRIIDGAGADKVDGGNGCDVLAQPIAPDPGDVLNGGGGACDFVSYADRSGDLTIRLNTTSAVNGEAGEGDSVRTVENAFGGLGDDSVIGSGAANHLIGFYGFDVLEGLGGADTLESTDSFPGNDVVACGYGADVAHIDPDDTATGCETIIGG